MSRGTTLCALVCLVAAGCGGERKKPDAGVIEEPLKSRAMTKGDKPIAPPPTLPMPRELSMKVKERGAEPRIRLRYRLAGDAERKVIATLAVTSRTLRDSTWSAPITLPRMRHGMAVRPERSAAGGRLLVRPLAVEIDPSDATDAQKLAAAQAERWRLIAGRRANIGVDDRGRIRSVAFADTPADTGAPGTMPAPARDELWQWLLGAVVPLPDEAVGKGARWVVKSVLRIGTATVEQIGEYALVAEDADTLTIEVSIRRIGEPQAADAAGLPPGSIAELIALLRWTKGTLTVSAVDGLPIRGKLDLELGVHARFHVPDQPKIDVASQDMGTLTFTSE